LALSLRLFGITPGDDGHHRNLQALAEAAARGGVDALIIREPHISERRLVTLSRRLAPWFGPGLILHARHPDALELASSAGWGLHLPSGGKPRQARDQVKGLLGISCHTQAELSEAHEAGCDYAMLSPIYKPSSKPQDTRQTLGLTRMRRAIAGCPMPVIALGGLTAARAGRCVAAGAHGIATMGGLFAEDMSPEDCTSAASKLRAALNEG
jgi:thiamine-phosphate pyrophosphorylase